MELKYTFSARFCEIEIIDGGKFHTNKEYEIYLNGKFLRKTNNVVNYIGGLKPDTEYKIDIGDKSAEFKTDHEFVTLNVKKFGAKGDGISDDTVFIQAAVYACPPESSRVLIPKGKYKVTSVFLKSGVNIEIAEGAEIIADTERFSHPIFPGMIQSYDEKSEYNLGTWEGNPLKCFAGIFTGIGVCGVCIYGEGKINGAASHENWWKNEKKMVGAFRPRLLFLERCKNVGVYNISFENSPSWTIHPYFSENVYFEGIKINNPENSPNTDGIDIESCKNVEIKGVEFTLGDDCIAVKSGKIYMGRKYKVPSENIRIEYCLMQNGHGAVTLGSEMSAGVKNLTVSSCFFKSTDRGLRIKTRRGRGELSVIDNIVFENIEMDNVKTPFVVNSFYFCDPDGRTSYVQDRVPCPVDERTPYVGKMRFENINAKNCHAAAAFFMGLPERKITEIVMKNINIEFAENASPAVPAMLCGVGEMKKAGIIAENAEKLSFENVTLKGHEGEAAVLSNVDEVKGEIISCR